MSEIPNSDSSLISETHFEEDRSISGSHLLPEHVSINFYLSPHGFAGDAPFLKERLARADIFAPEIHGWKPKHLKAYEGISGGDYRSLEQIRQPTRVKKGSGTFTEAQVTALYNTRLPVVMFDVEDSDPIASQSRRYLLDKTWFSDNFHSEFGLTIEGLRKYFGEQAGPITHRREEVMLENLTTRVPALIEAHPKLRKMVSVAVLVALGAEHTNVYNQLKKDNPKPRQVTREFDRMPEIFPYFTRCLRAGALGLEITNEELARLIAEKLTQAVLDEHGLKLSYATTTERYEPFFRAIDPLSIDEIVSLYNHANLVLNSDTDFDLEHPVVSKIVDSLFE